MQTLAQLHDAPPRVRPIKTPTQAAGWLFDGPRSMLMQHLNSDTQAVLEVGSWRGLSTRFILERAPNAVIYCVDTWDGSVEHPDMFKDSTEEVLRTLYDHFVSGCWKYRDRIIPVRMASALGIPLVAKENARIDLCYIDGSHEYQDVRDDIDACMVFHHATVMGDDYAGEWPGVVEAVKHAAAEYEMEVEINPPAWRLHR